MALLKNVLLTVHSYIENLDECGNSDGYPERSDTMHEAKMSAEADRIILTYTERTEGGTVLWRVECCADTITVTRSGAASSVMRFNTSTPYEGIYEVSPFKFDMKIVTSGLKNRLTLFGGSVDILYTMSIGGADKRCRMKMTVGEVRV
ncbi:MAG: DUF1934 domain-containing protein [Clostridia bacterium]|nr:DUF1934 domain-containing protein [Clostridia bacterium]